MRKSKSEAARLRQDYSECLFQDFISDYPAQTVRRNTLPRLQAELDALKINLRLK
ncbi:MAG: hypothetical protein V3U57_01825 [Robiginitomaculum sp.]